MNVDDAKRVRSRSGPDVWARRIYKAHLACLGLYVAFALLTPPNLFAVLIWLVVLATWIGSTLLCLWNAVSHQPARWLALKSALIAPLVLYALSLVGTVFDPPLIPSPYGGMLLILLLVSYPGWRILRWFARQFDLYPSDAQPTAIAAPEQPKSSTQAANPSKLSLVTTIALAILCPIACLSLYFVLVLVASLNDTQLPAAQGVADLLPALMWVGIPAALVALPYAIAGLIRGVRRKAMTLLLSACLATLLCIAGSVVAIGALSVSAAG